MQIGGTNTVFLLLRDQRLKIVYFFDISSAINSEGSVRLVPLNYFFFICFNLVLYIEYFFDCSFDFGCVFDISLRSIEQFVFENR